MDPPGPSAHPSTARSGSRSRSSCRRPRSSRPHCHAGRERGWVRAREGKSASAAVDGRLRGCRDEQALELHYTSHHSHPSNSYLICQHIHTLPSLTHPLTHPPTHSDPSFAQSLPHWPTPFAPHLQHCATPFTGSHVALPTLIPHSGRGVGEGHGRKVAEGKKEQRLATDGWAWVLGWWRRKG